MYPERESKSLELKRDLVDSFLKSVSAFANFGTGKVIFGVSDDGTVTGVTNGEKLSSRLKTRLMIASHQSLSSNWRQSSSMDNSLSN